LPLKKPKNNYNFFFLAKEVEQPLPPNIWIENTESNKKRGEIIPKLLKNNYIHSKQ